MSSRGRTIARGLLALTFVGVAVLKFESAIHGDSPAAAWQLGSAPVFVLIGAAELVLAVLLFTRGAAHAAIGMLGIAMAGNFVVAIQLWNGSVPNCGCLGSVALEPSQHLALTVVIAVLVAMIVLPGRRPS